MQSECDDLLTFSGVATQRFPSLGEGLIEEWNRTQVQTVWANVVTWCETPLTIAITTNLAFFIIPKQRVPAEELQNLRGFLTGKVIRGTGEFPVENLGGDGKDAEAPRPDERVV